MKLMAQVRNKNYIEWRSMNFMAQARNKVTFKQTTEKVKSFCTRKFPTRAACACTCIRVASNRPHRTVVKRIISTCV